MNSVSNSWRRVRGKYCGAVKFWPVVTDGRTSPGPNDTGSVATSFHM